MIDPRGAALLPRFGGYAVEDATGTVLAICDEREEAEEAVRDGELYYDDAACCGHPSASAWVRERLPISFRIVTVEEAEAMREEATPLLEREP
jgi:hypothetical protein